MTLTFMHTNTKEAHAALAIPEVVRHIIGQLEPTILCTFHPDSSPYFKRNTGDLLAVAKTCKSFSAHALDQLWSNVTSLFPLFSILSNFDNEVRFIIIADVHCTP